MNPMCGTDSSQLKPDLMWYFFTLFLMYIIVSATSHISRHFGILKALKPHRQSRN
uniref:Uncharacterized protein n=1 Tax=Anguilla anguilla TaxID=7936 RepID=A0A0E9W7Z2_ANGAN